jgi:hypothetical protein
LESAGLVCISEQKHRSGIHEDIVAESTPVKRDTWTPSHTYWYVSLGKEHYYAIQEVFKGKVILDTEVLKKWLEQSKAALPFCLFTLNDLTLKTLSTQLLLQNAHAAFHKFF